MILARYLAKEVLLNTAAVTLVLVLIGVANQFVVFLSRAAAGDLPVGLVLEVVALSIPSFLSFLLPFGLFLGVLLAYGRLYTETEMTVMLACGFSIGRLVWTTCVTAIPVVILCGLLTLWMTPASQLRLEYLYAHVRADVLSQFIQEGQFQSWDQGRYVVYIGSVNTDEKTVKKVFIAQQPHLDQTASQNLSILTGASGYLWTDPQTHVEYIVLNEGKRYAGMPGNAEYTLLNFEQYGIRLPTQEIHPRERGRTKTTSTLLAHPNVESWSELQWRFTLPFSIIMVALLSVPLSRVPPRKGRFHAIFPAMVVMLTYTLSLMLTKSWVAEGWMPAWLGLLWPHTVAFIFVMYLLEKQTHWLKRLLKFGGN